MKREDDRVRVIARCATAVLVGAAACGGDSGRDAVRDDTSIAVSTAAAMPEGLDLQVPSDARAQFRVLEIAGTPEMPTIVTFRRGPSGDSYSRRRYDCAARTVMYLGTGDTREEMELPRPDPGMAPIVDEAIADYVGRVACDTAMQRQLRPRETSSVQPK